MSVQNNVDLLVRSMTGAIAEKVHGSKLQIFKLIFD
jgi:hypothetical protein